MSLVCWLLCWAQFLFQRTVQNKPSCAWYRGNLCFQHCVYHFLKIKLYWLRIRIWNDIHVGIIYSKIHRKKKVFHLINCYLCRHIELFINGCHTWKYIKDNKQNKNMKPETETLFFCSSIFQCPSIKTFTKQYIHTKNVWANIYIPTYIKSINLWYNMRCSYSDNLLQLPR